MRVPDSRILYDWGFSLMQEALVIGRPDHRRAAYRDGLLIALFAARAPRALSMASLRLGQTVTKVGKVYRIVFEKEDVKTGRCIEYNAPAKLTAAIDRYITVERPVLLAGQAHDAFWVGRYGKPMSSDQLTNMIQYRSKKRLGFNFGPHRFRHRWERLLRWQTLRTPAWPPRSSASPATWWRSITIGPIKLTSRTSSTQLFARSGPASNPWLVAHSVSRENERLPPMRGRMLKRIPALRTRSDVTERQLMNPSYEQPPPTALTALQVSQRRPWDIHPALTEDRLRACALLLAHARRDAVRLAAYEMGGDSWSVGCRAYAFGRQRLRRAAERRTYNWLTVLDESHHFVAWRRALATRRVGRNERCCSAGQFDHQTPDSDREVGLARQGRSPGVSERCQLQGWLRTQAIPHRNSIYGIMLLLLCDQCFAECLLARPD